MTTRLHASIALAWATAACAVDSRGSGTVTIADSAGVEIVTHHVTKALESEWTLDATPITRIGDDSTDVNQQFRGLPRAVRLSNGHIVLTAEQVLSVFDSSGVHLRTLARPGPGPGELRYVSGMVVLPGDTVVVRDRGRVLKFAPDSGGVLVSEEQYPCSRERPPFESAYCLTEFFSDGSALVVTEDSTIPRSPTNRESRLLANGFTSPGPGHLREVYRVFIVPASLDTAYSTGYSAGVEQYGIDLGPQRTFFVMHPFYSRAFRASGGSPRRLAIAFNPEYSVEIWDDRGRLLRIIRRTNARRVPSAEDHEEARQFVEQQVREGPVTVERALAEMPIPDSLPAVDGLVVGAGGDVLVQTSGWRSADSVSAFDVFDSQGAWIAEWTLPRRVRVLEMGRDYLLTGRISDEEIPLIEVWRFRRP